MGWTAPATYSVAEVVTAAKLNTHIRDNLDYLKGNAGQVVIANEVAPTGVVATRDDGGYQFICARAAATARSYGFAVIGSGGNAGAFAINDVTGAATRMQIDTSGNVAIGTTATGQGKLSVVGAGGGMLYFSATTVNATLQTPVIAGTVTVMAIMWGMIRNNGGTSLSFIGLISANTFALGTALIVNCNTASDQVTITVTAGGAITVQRTAGSNSHEVNIVCFYK